MSTEAHESVSPASDALQKVGEQCPHAKQTTVREAAEAVTKGFSALEVLLAAQDADIPDAEPLLVMVSGRREEIGTYGQLRALRRALNFAHPQQGGERDGWKLVPVEPTRDMLCAWMGYVSGASVPSASYEDLMRMYYRRMMEAVPTAPTSSSKSSGEEA